jgi:hypothetical protein
MLTDGELTLHPFESQLQNLAQKPRVVRNLLTVPSGGGAKGLKTTKLMIVDAVGEEDEEPQGEGRG